MFGIYFTAAVVVLVTLFLLFEVVRPVYVMLGGLFLLYAGGILSLEESLEGFSNQGMLTLAALYIVATTLQSSSAFRFAVDRILRGTSRKAFYLRLMTPVAAISAFMNNTPVVASLIPVMKRWSLRNHVPASKLMLPLSYAAILGGMCTLIGSSTNLVVHGLLLNSGSQGFGFFEIGKVGLPVALFVILYYSFFGHRFLPDRKAALETLSESVREFTAEVRVGKEFPHLHKTIEEAHLRHLRGLFLFQVVRNGEEIAPVPPSEAVLPGDRLFFTGLPETILDLVKTPGLHLVKDHEFDVRNLDSDKHKTFEAVISNNSPLIGQSVRESGFRTRYNAVILAVHRNGQRINQKVGDIEFRPNDTLFLLAGKDFEVKWLRSEDFSLVSQSVTEYSKPRLKGNMALTMVVAMIVLVATGVVKSMLVAAAVTAGLFLALHIISVRDARSSIDFQVLLVIVAALGIGRGMLASGLADRIASGVLNLLNPYGVIGMLAGIFFITSLYTELITNNAAAALMFPVVWSLCRQQQLPVEPFMITLAIAASSSFSTPIGYQTNMMVYGPGGYKFRDYLRNGVVLNLLTGVITTLVVYWMYFVGS